MTKNVMQNSQTNEIPNARPRVIPKNADLRDKCIRPGDESDAAREAIARAEQALDDLSVNFDDWMQNETDKLTQTRDQALGTQFSTEQLEAFYQAAHNLKGQASTLGYPFADEICASLCRLLDKTPEKAKLPKALVNQHVDAVRALVNENAKGSDNPKASILAKRLRDVTNDFLSSLTRNQSAA